MREDENTSAKTPADEDKDEIGEILNEVRQRQARESGREPSVKDNAAPVQSAPAKAPEQTPAPGQDAHVPQPVHPEDMLRSLFFPGFIEAIESFLTSLQPGPRRGRRILSSVMSSMALIILGSASLAILSVISLPTAFFCSGR